jgi:prolyl-tRNA synthetase
MSQVINILTDIKYTLLENAKQYRDKYTHTINTFDEFKAFFTNSDDENSFNETRGGFAKCYAVNDPCIEEFIKPLRVTARCIPLEEKGIHAGVHCNDEIGTCIFTGKPTSTKMIFAKSY